MGPVAGFCLLGKGKREEEGVMTEGVANEGLLGKGKGQDACL